VHAALCWMSKAGLCGVVEHDEPCIKLEVNIQALDYIVV
jgi:hypothetical protein